MKKIVTMVCAMAMAISTLAGCGAPKAPNVPAAAEQKEAAAPAAEQKDTGAPASSAKEMTIYIRMMEAQDIWFKENIIIPFEKEYGVKLNVRSFEDTSDLHNILELDRDKKTVGLVKTEVTQIVPLVSKDYMMPLEEAAGRDISADLQEYIDNALEVGKVNGAYYYIPRKIEPFFAVYLKSKVEEAVKNWEPMKAQINELVKKQNGYGLPDGYTLEANPSEWDYYDVAVVGYYWANTEYNGKKEPKIAHRSKDYSGTSLELVGRVYSLGGTPEDVMKMNTTPVADMLGWESFYKEGGIYNPTMWEENWTGGGIWNGYASGSVFMSYMAPMDSFFIHGGSHPTMTGYLTDPDDMGIAIFPKGVSLEIENGKPKREGAHTAILNGWWWGIPKSTPDAKLSYELARWITNAENQKAECSTFGIPPVRKDLMENLDTTFAEDWMGDIFKTFKEQLDAGVIPTPQVESWVEIGPLYNKAWLDIVVGGNNKDIQKTLDDSYAK